ncbi:uncharacterized protein BDR25DRAFT_349754 [Lindgomyces ingoldianus]|uniref:Uncharacterized protein n=1 Tax=Lindgomyces ingoldianus TaxID=673940 RepID=A0ACB6RDT7_9PLEO|nr:uncharacterized protein BDR25DRAFT_349754 [Lindgomyces ingoldianus]KAF2476682.1 hypothetical protein BDR25DRAFT_349754 [Lindgomyces ingoldianus]
MPSELNPKHYFRPVSQAINNLAINLECRKAHGGRQRDTEEANACLPQFLTLLIKCLHLTPQSSLNDINTPALVHRGPLFSLHPPQYLLCAWSQYLVMRLETLSGCAIQHRGCICFRDFDEELRIAYLLSEERSRSYLAAGSYDEHSPEAHGELSTTPHFSLIWFQILSVERRTEKAPQYRFAISTSVSKISTSASFQSPAFLSLISSTPLSFPNPTPTSNP